MGIQFSGLASGLDTQSIVADLMKAEHTKVDNVEKEKTKEEWTKDAWSDMNSELYSFYKSDLFSFKSSSTYSQKTISSSNESVVTASSTSSNSGVHEVTINNMARGSYLTGAEISGDVSGSTKLSDLVTGFSGASFNIKSDLSAASAFDVSNQVTVGADATIDDLVSAINDLEGVDVKASFDDSFDRLFLSSSETGQDVRIQISDGGDSGANTMLQALGFSFGLADTTGDGNADSTVVSGSAGENAEFVYNGTTLSSTTNQVSVNGLDLNIKADSGSASISVSTDADKIYESVKTFITSYNELVTNMVGKLDADSSYGYDPLTSDEKSAMTDDEISQWEAKIKNSLLRKDETLTSIQYDMRSILGGSSGVDTSGMSYNFLADLGIVSGNYSEQGLLHIEGDSDDYYYGAKDNRLMEAIKEDPDGVKELLTSVGQKLYDTMQTRMQSTSLSSALTFYNDKYMDEQIDDYTDDISDLETTLDTVEERYYSQFNAMEQAIQQSNSTGDWLAQQLSAL